MHQKLRLLFFGLLIQTISQLVFAKDFIFTLPEISGTPGICDTSKINVTNHPDAAVSSLLFEKPLIDLQEETLKKKYFKSSCSIIFYPEKYSESLKADLFVDVRMQVMKSTNSALTFYIVINGRSQKLDYIPSRYIDEKNTDDIRLLRFKISNFEYSKKSIKINLLAKGFVQSSVSSLTPEISFLSIDSIDLCLATQTQSSCGNNI